MQAAQPDDVALPPLREDLSISPGAPLLNGAPSWVIYDPIRHRFFQVGQRTIEMISSWSSGTVARLHSELKAKRALQVGEQEVRAVREFLKTSDLLAERGPGVAKSFARRAEAQRSSPIKWALHRYIFFRMPLLRPNAFLIATWPLVRPLFSRGFAALTAMVLVLALYLASRQFSDLQAHFQGAFSLTGAMTYAIALIFVKILHELGHAYQAVARGLRVPVMGVAFIVMFPLLYTDTTDAWRLRKRRDRVMVDLGGIMVELTLAIYATLLWCFLPDGPARNAAFAVATVSWVFSLLVNLNPLMRFDGYYLLADSLGVHNLQPRSFMMGRWALRELLFGIGAAPPEKLSRPMRIFMVAYSYATWIYRFFLFLSIALIVYALTFKALGIILFLAEIMFFIATPVLREIKVWIDMRERILWSLRSWCTFVVVTLLGALAVIPMSGRIQVPAVLDEARQQAIYSSIDGRLKEVFVTDGQAVRSGDLLFSFEDPELPMTILQAQQRIALNEARLRAGAGDAVERASRVIIERQIEQEREAMSALKDRQSELQVRAPLDGILRDLIPDREPGTWFGRKRFLGRIVNPGGFIVRGFIREGDLMRIDHERAGKFIADELRIPKFPLQDISVADFSVTRLPDGYLSALNGGEIPVLDGDPDVSRPKGVWYPLDAKVSGALSAASGLDTIQPGVVVLRTKPESFALRTFRRVARVLIREADL
ncbi:biotin/lipoyl-binding protein [Roseovarius sp. Pro17]|uniref:site-2 protease family protein n=1 Tax=Roseovarius sp. Pro17 TaxID=3108175 RepID=UPI002D7888F3|nr:biotin/lipoyl-binding protein [Roseovarius sp. Pro17]